MSDRKQVVSWVTRGYNIECDDKQEVEQTIRAIRENGISDNGIDISLESIEAKSKKIHFESDIVQVDEL